MRFFLPILFICLIINLQAQNTYSPSAGNTTVNIPCGVTHTFVDNGGSGANYSANLNYTVTFKPATAGQCLKITFNSFAIHNTDQITIYDGSNSLGSYFGGALTNANAPLPVITSTSGALTFVFVSDALTQNTGWLATIECITCLGPQISMSNTSQTLTCGTAYQFFDSGGQGNDYSNSESLTQTFYPSTSGSCLNISFQGINTANNDILTIYDGTSTASPLIGSYVNQNLPPNFNTSGPVTFQWTSNATTTRAGWYAIIQCTTCPATITQTVTCGTPLSFYDTGGSAGNYSNSENYTVTVVPGTVGQCLSVNFNSFSTNSSNDILSIYDGGSSSSPLIGSYFNTTVPPTFTTSGGAVTFVFVSDGSGVSTGWNAVVACVNCTNTATTYLMNGTNVSLVCPSTSLFYDSGGSGGSYANNENFTKTFTAPAGSCLQVAFSSAFNVESCCDKLKIFDGSSGASPSLGSYAGTSGPGILQTAGTSVTFSFTSDGSIVKAGWEATITCVSACSGTPAGGNVTSATSPCPSTGSVGLIVNNSTAACGLTYQWQSAASSSGPWTNISGATSVSLSVPTSTSTYYRRLTSCGANTGTSTASNASIQGVTCSPSYVASNITYSFTTFSGNLTPTTDDVLYSNIALFGFPFCYGGSAYWGGYIASNSAFVFDAVPCYPNVSSNSYAAAGINTGWSISLPAPNTTEAPRNAILAPWHDTYPPAGGVIQYTTVGTSPNRVFIASWENIPMFSCSTSSPSIYATSQVKIFETTNIIEIHVGKKGVCPGWNDGSAILGLHNYNGTVYTPPVNATAHNAPTSPATYTWAMTNTAYRFTPNACAAGSGGSCMVLPIILKAFYGERENKINHLYFETAEEKNVKAFLIERSQDGINFEIIGSIIPKQDPTKYTYDDINAKDGIVNYYRISIEDNNGTVSRTFIYPLGGISSEDDMTVLSVHPNPSRSNYKVMLDSRYKGKLTMNIFSGYGVLLKTVIGDLQKGTNSYDVYAEDLTAGIYILSLESSETGNTVKVKLIRD
jgi:hypothetical protein